MTYQFSQQLRRILLVLSMTLRTPNHCPSKRLLLACGSASCDRDTQSEQCEKYAPVRSLNSIKRQVQLPWTGQSSVGDGWIDAVDHD